MANVKSFVKKQFSFLVIFLIFFASISSTMTISSLSAAINPKADLNLKSSSEANSQANSQMINLNLQFRSHHKILTSELAMPYYQTAELEKSFDKKNYLIEVNPRHGKKSDEVEIEMRFFKTAGSKAFAKKEIIAKIGEESTISIKGMTVKVTPVL